MRVLVDADTVVVDAPASHRSLRLLRLAAADAATELDMDMDGVERARIAVDELAALLLGTGEWRRIVVTLRISGGRLEGHGEVRDALGDVRPVEVDPVVAELLATCVDDHELLDGPAFRFTLVPAPRRGGGG